MDGANVEIAEAVGNDNIYIFGQSSKQVIHPYALFDTLPRDWYEADRIYAVLSTSSQVRKCLKYGDEEHLKRLQHELINKDWFQTLPDFNAYVVRKEQAMKTMQSTRKTGAAEHVPILKQDSSHQTERLPNTIRTSGIWENK